LAILGVALTFASDAFLTTTICSTCCAQASLYFLLASGLTLVILTAGLDLSVGANVAYRPASRRASCRRPARRRSARSPAWARARWSGC